MNAIYNTELVEVSFNADTFEWNANFIFNNIGETTKISITESEAKSILSSFECVISCIGNIVYYSTAL